MKTNLIIWFICLILGCLVGWFAAESTIEDLETYTSTVRNPIIGEYGVAVNILDLSFEAPPTFDDPLDAIEQVESGGDADAVGDGGRAIGAYQLHKIYVDDINRIIGKKRFTYEERWDRYRSREMTDIYTTHYAQIAARHYLKTYMGTMEPKDGVDVPMFEIIARIHNGGPDGWRNDPEWFVRNRGYTLEQAEKKIANTKAYWSKVKRVLEAE